MAIGKGQPMFDVVLSNMLIDYANGNFVGLEAAPLMPVSQTRFQWVQFDDDAIYSGNNTRAPGEQVKRFTSDFGQTEGDLDYHDIEYFLPREFTRLKDVDGIDREDQAMRRSAYAIELEQELSIVGTLINPANYPSTNKVTLTGSNQFSDPTSNPIRTFQIARNAVYDQIGEYPNKTVMSINAFQALQEHPQTAARIRNYQNSSSLQAQAEAIAAIYGLGRLLISTAAYRPIGTPLSNPRVKIMPNQVLMTYTPDAPANPSQGNEIQGGRLIPNPNSDRSVPSAAYTFILDGRTIYAEVPYEDRPHKAIVYPSGSAYKTVITQSVGSYLISNPVA
jgi:hypothetical protein